MSAIKIELLNDAGAVTETVDAVEVAEPCETTQDWGSAFCIGPVYRFTTPVAGMTFDLCRKCIDADDYVRVERAVPVVNPETGVETYPWTMPDGRPVDADGYPTGE